MPTALKERPELDEVEQMYFEEFLFLSKFEDEHGVISLQDIYIHADTILEDRIEFAKIMNICSAALIEARKDKSESDHEVKKPG